MRTARAPRSCTCQCCTAARPRCSPRPPAATWAQACTTSTRSASASFSCSSRCSDSSRRRGRTSPRRPLQLLALWRRRSRRKNTVHCINMGFALILSELASFSICFLNDQRDFFRSQYKSHVFCGFSEEEPSTYLFSYLFVFSQSIL